MPFQSLRSINLLFPLHQRQERCPLCRALTHTHKRTRSRAGLAYTYSRARIRTTYQTQTRTHTHTHSPTYTHMHTHSRASTLPHTHTHSHLRCQRQSLCGARTHNQTPYTQAANTANDNSSLACAQENRRALTLSYIHSWDTIQFATVHTRITLNNFSLKAPDRSLPSPSFEEQDW